MIKTREKWILEGLKFLAKDIKSPINIEKISKNANLPRTGFYYYWHSKTEFKHSMIDFLIHRTYLIQQNIDNFKSFRDYISWIVDNLSLEMKILKKLLSDEDEFLFRNTINKIQTHDTTLKGAIVIGKHYNINLSEENTLKLVKLMNEKIYSRLPDNLTVDAFIEVADEVYNEVAIFLKQ